VLLGAIGVDGPGIQAEADLRPPPRLGSLYVLGARRDDLLLYLQIEVGPDRFVHGSGQRQLAAPFRLIHADQLGLGQDLPARFNAERLGRNHIDAQTHGGRVVDGQITGIIAQQNTLDVQRRAPNDALLEVIGSTRCQHTCSHLELAPP